MEEFHEFDDALPRIYEEETGRTYNDSLISKNKYFGKEEAEILKGVCKDMYPEEELSEQMLMSLLDIEAKAAAISNKRNVVNKFESEIKKAFYKNEAEAEQIAENRSARLANAIEEPDDEFVE